MTTPVRRRYPVWRSYSVFHWALMVVALVFAVIWFMGSALHILTTPDWVPATGFLLLMVALWIP